MVGLVVVVEVFGVVCVGVVLLFLNGEVGCGFVVGFIFCFGCLIFFFGLGLGLGLGFGLGFGLWIIIDVFFGGLGVIFGFGLGLGLIMGFMIGCVVGGGLRLVGVIIVIFIGCVGEGCLII